MQHERRALCSSPMVIIKKYGNRRLYDTDSSRYVTMEELADTIRRGKDVRVIDAKTDEDLTQATLTQIIIEGRRAARLLPVPLLVQLIRMGDDSLAEFLGTYMTWALRIYLQAKQGAQAVAPYNPFVMAPFAATNALARFLGGGGGGGWEEPPRPTVVAPPPEPAPSPAAVDVADLRRELDELKKSLGKKKAPRRS
jgi:polyhydroxyalkanoate synthesis repressor PhaR